MAEKQPYNLIPVTPENLFKYTGNYFHKFEQGVFNVMRKLCPDYIGGAYEFRLYPNGAFSMVLPDDGSKHKVTPFNCSYVSDCTLEAISLAANLTMYSHLCCEAFEKNDTKHNQMLHDQFHGLKDALCGIMRYVVDATLPEGTRPVTDAEAMDYEQIGQRAHAEIGEIMEIID